MGGGGEPEGQPESGAQSPESSLPAVAARAGLNHL